MPIRNIVSLSCLVLALSLANHAAGQQATPSPSPKPSPTRNDEQDAVKIYTEEVRLPVLAVDQYGHFDPTLEPNDILVLEDGVPQQIKSVRHVPASRESAAMI